MCGKKKKHFKNTLFTAVGLSSVQMVADWHSHAAYHNKHWRLAF